MSEKEKKREGKKAKGDEEEKEGKPTKETKDAKSKKDKENTDFNKKGGTAKEGDKKGVSAKVTNTKVGVATLPIDPNAPPPLDAEGNPICVQPDPKPTFAELWFDDPVEGEYAQKMAMDLRGRIEVKALSIRQYLEGAIVDLLLQGLQALVLARPTNAAEYLAAFLLRNNPLKDKDFVEPPEVLSRQSTPPKVQAPKCSCCKVHCPPSEQVPDFYRKGDKIGPVDLPKEGKVAPTQALKKTP